ncbi:MAG: hypothetical protein KOO63_12535 [Bacteroidales bacterium]|nr:hypothetical protein [Candidatus Latescibacterota bacterium]
MKIINWIKDAISRVKTRKRSRGEPDVVSDDQGIEVDDTMLQVPIEEDEVVVGDVDDPVEIEEIESAEINEVTEEVVETIIEKKTEKGRAYRQISSIREVKRAGWKNSGPDLSGVTYHDQEEEDNMRGEEYNIMSGQERLQVRKPAPGTVINMHKLGKTPVIQGKAIFTVSEPSDTDIVVDPALDLGDDLFSEVARRINLKLRRSQSNLDEIKE